MNKQYKDSITSTGAGYQKQPANEIGSYQSPELSTEFSEINRGFPVGAVPTPENSKRKSDVSQLNPGMDSAPNVGNLSC